MTLNEAQADVCRQIAHSKLKGLSPEHALSHAVTGLTEEAGEVAGLLKREIFKQNIQPQDRWLEELGDVFWYLCAAASEKGLTLEDIFKANRAKLKIRYGDWENESN